MAKLQSCQSLDVSAIEWCTRWSRVGTVELQLSKPSLWFCVVTTPEYPV